MADMSGRYARQEILPEVGPEGQAAIRAGSVLMVGVGGLGSPAGLYLAAAGVGRIGLVDPDRVDVSNLQRQVAFDSQQAGARKVDAAAQRLERLNPDVTVETHAVGLDGGNVERLFRDYDVILDGTDNFGAKFLINDAGVKFGKPVVYGSILGFEGQVAVFGGGRDDAACYRCLYPCPPKGHVPNCAEAGVLGALAGMIGSAQALEAVKLLVAGQSGALSPLAGRLWTLDARDMSSRCLTVPRNPACRVCGGDPARIELRMEGGACEANVPAVPPEEVARTEDVCLVDCREADEWRTGHIPGAVHAPLSELMADRLPDLPARRVVVYCQQGIRSRQACGELRRMGFDDIAHMEGGLAAWEGPVSAA